MQDINKAVDELLEAKGEVKFTPAQIKELLSILPEMMGPELKGSAFDVQNDVIGDVIAALGVEDDSPGYDAAFDKVNNTVDGAVTTATAAAKAAFKEAMEKAVLKK